jgi:hypothetical protein
MSNVGFGMDIVSVGMTNVLCEISNDISAEYDFNSAFLKIRIVMNMLF